MKVKVLFFGMTRDLTGLREETLEVCDGETVAGLWRAYERRFPALRQASASLHFALNEEMSKPDDPLHDGDELAVMPPVSGGASNSHYALTREPLQAEGISRLLRNGQSGAVVVFEGTVRECSAGKRVSFLEYEAYEPLALRKMQEIGNEVEHRFAIDRVAMEHRLGRVEIGETSVVVAVAAAHRAAAFDACRYAMDRLKQVVPIWKKEHFEDGAAWAEGEGQVHVVSEPHGK
jgi:molybdopterin synthase catalytic subunit